MCEIVIPESSHKEMMTVIAFSTIDICDVIFKAICDEDCSAMIVQLPRPFNIMNYQPDTLIVLRNHRDTNKRILIRIKSINYNLSFGKEYKDGLDHKDGIYIAMTFEMKSMFTASNQLNK
jgi:hypothetical protein